MQRLSNLDIQAFFRHDPYFDGVYSKDRLPAKIAAKNYVVNMDNSSGGGTHWVAVCNVGENCFYFDPFGVDPPPAILEFMKSGTKQCMGNTVQIQDIKSNACGYFCCYVIKESLKRDVVDVLYDFSTNKKKNDSFIKAWWSKQK
ncbi:TPA_asm: adenain [Capsaspora MELD virus 2]|nr:TPA_asm: adenain [Capsaspora MELD virus 2]